MNNIKTQKLIEEFNQLSQILHFDLSASDIKDLLQNWQVIYQSFELVKKINVTNVLVTNLLPQLENHNFTTSDNIVVKNTSEHNLQTVCSVENNLAKVK